MSLGSDPGTLLTVSYIDFPNMGERYLANLQCVLLMDPMEIKFTSQSEVGAEVVQGMECLGSRRWQGTRRMGKFVSIERQQSCTEDAMIEYSVDEICKIRV
jgi:hypothetical protein